MDSQKLAEDQLSVLVIGQSTHILRLDLISVLFPSKKYIRLGDCEKIRTATEVGERFLTWTYTSASYNLLIETPVAQYNRGTKRLVSVNICSVEGNSADIFVSQVSPGIFVIKER